MERSAYVMFSRYNHACYTGLTHDSSAILIAVDRVGLETLVVAVGRIR